MPTDIVNQMTVFNAHDHRIEKTQSEYIELIKILETLKSFDENCACFDSYNDIIYNMRTIVKHYDIYVAEYEAHPIGGLLIDNIYSDGSVIDIGLVIAKGYRNRGIGSELLGRAIKTCFEEMGCRKIKMSHSANNDMSRAVIQKYGFVFDNSSISFKSIYGNGRAKLNYVLSNSNYLKQKEKYVSVKTLR